jgi:hypothetical protein
MQLHILQNSILVRRLYGLSRPKKMIKFILSVVYITMNSTMTYACILKAHSHSKEAQIELPLIECECE